MSVANIKQELYRVIEGIDNKELLQVALTFLSKGKFQQQVYDFTDDQLQLLKEREQAYMEGERKTQTFEEFRMKMNKKHSL